MGWRQPRGCFFITEKGATMGEYLKKLFQLDLWFCISGVGTLLYKFLFPEKQYLYGAGAVLVIMVLDLITKLYALSRQSGGLKKAFIEQKISSNSFYKGTRDKLLVFGILIVVGGCAYRLTGISELGTWFTQLVYTLMFLRDLLSILENLRDAGVGGLRIFEKAVKKKMEEYVDVDEEDLK